MLLQHRLEVLMCIGFGTLINCACHSLQDESACDFQSSVQIKGTDRGFENRRTKGHRQVAVGADAVSENQEVGQPDFVGDERIVASDG